VNAQVSDVQFGKNRIQYHDDFDQWLYYDSPLITVYWYGKSRAVGEKVVRIAEQEFKDIIRTLDFKTNEKTEFLVFADVSDMKQSNIGHDDAFTFQDGLTHTEENKVFIHFDGNHNHLRRQIREGIASVYINNILFGSNLQEIVQNSIMLNLPEWYKTGLISYCGRKWGTDLELRLRYLLSKRRISSFERLAKEDPLIAGHIFWNYLDINFGRSTIGNLVYVTRINRNLKRAFQYALGESYDDFLEKVFTYYKDSYSPLKINARQSKQDRLIKLKKGEQVTALAYSPDGTKLACAVNNLGKVRIYSIDVLSGKKKKLYSYGVKNTIQPPDLQYPAFAWDESSTHLVCTYERLDQIYIREFPLTKQHKSSRVWIVPKRFQRIYHIAWWDKNSLILNANSVGSSDIYWFDLRTRQSFPILEDPFDDLDAIVTNYKGEKCILFSSNRKNVNRDKIDSDSLLPVGNFDLYMLAPVGVINKDSPWEMKQITDTPGYSEWAPAVDENSGKLSYMTNAWVGNGIETVSLSKGKGDRPAVFQRDVVLSAFAWSSVSNQAVFCGFDGLKKVAVKVPGNLFLEGNVNPSPEAERTRFISDIEDPSLRQNSKNKSISTARDSIPEDQKFITRWPDIMIDKSSQEEGKSAKPALIAATQYMQPLNRLKIIPYRLQFRIEDSGVRFDNTPLFDGLTAYTGSGGDGLLSPVGLLLFGKLMDKFDDYQLEGGIRIPVSLNGNETYLTYTDRKHRLDQKVSLYRKTSSERQDQVIQTAINKNIILLGQYEVKYPIDIFNAVTLSATLRQDKTIFKATESQSLDSASVSIERIGLRATYVIDNTMEESLNLLNGTRAKVFAEWQKKFDLQIGDSWGFSFNKGNMLVVGLDARQYIPLDRNTILAGRLAAQSSFGSEQILYYLGGVQNWLFPSFNNFTRIDENANYAYRMPAPNLRGFQYNIRNGNSFALTNIELRVPIFRYLSYGTIRSAFLRNFQLNFFADAGTAWNGVSPFSKYNPLNTTIISQKDIEVKVNYFRNPIVYGYGVGARILLFGYFVRLDYAWGYDSGNISPPRFYISFGTDF
jgi:hypothetical protein